LDILRVKGKKVPMGVYELLAERDLTDATRARNLEERICNYEQALALYQARQWDAAELKLLEIIRQFEEDGSAQALLARVRDYKASPPDAEWDGVYVSKTK
jgi:adenylate cyclase